MFVMDECLLAHIVGIFPHFIMLYVLLFFICIPFSRLELQNVNEPNWLFKWYRNWTNWCNSNRSIYLCTNCERPNQQIIKMIRDIFGDFFSRLSFHLIDIVVKCLFKENWIRFMITHQIFLLLLHQKKGKNSIM